MENIFVRRQNQTGILDGSINADRNGSVVDELWNVIYARHETTKTLRAECDGNSRRYSAGVLQKISKVGEIQIM